MRAEKVCPYVLRGAEDGPEVLAFRHPLAGCQLVKGTLEPGESVEAGALRELAEESGLVGVPADSPAWSSPDIVQGQLWHFVPVVVPPQPDDFEFLCADDGGHLFKFFWWPLGTVPGGEWHESFVRVLDEIRVRCM